MTAERTAAPVLLVIAGRDVTVGMIDENGADDLPCVELWLQTTSGTVVVAAR